MTGHTCATCCQVLSKLDDILQVDTEEPARLPRWWRILHPLLWYRARVRGDYALDLLDESGK